MTKDPPQQLALIGRKKKRGFTRTFIGAFGASSNQLLTFVQAVAYTKRNLQQYRSET